MFYDEIVELVDVECRTAVVDESAYAVFLRLTLFVVMVVMMVMTVVVSIVVLSGVMMLMFPGLGLFLVSRNGLNTLNPAGRCRHLIVAEHPGIED